MFQLQSSTLPFDPNSIFQKFWKSSFMQGVCRQNHEEQATNGNVCLDVCQSCQLWHVHYGLAKF